MGQPNYPGKTPFQHKYGGRMVTGLSGIVPFVNHSVHASAVPINKPKTLLSLFGKKK